MKNFKFKLVDLTFEIKKLKAYDQEYLRTMVFETIGERSIKNSGKSFTDMYPNSKNFTLFNNESEMINYMSNFSGNYANVASHLLDGDKYYFAWTFSSKY
jgi:hypothetical protein|tara:strand:- start:94 stop:393 length:300 start_codon:yes stop_codon:yes gene_type:complete